MRHRPGVLGAGVAGHDLGQPVAVVRRRRQQAEGDRLRLLRQAAACEAEQDDRVVVRPGTPPVVGERVVTRLVRGERPDGPSGEEVGFQPASSRSTGVLSVEGAGPQELSVEGAGPQELSGVGGR
ncbi:hypothetical protein QFZ58_006448 [Streptomyces sp. B1I3]|nr:hypothetical protein [Streptomyces sp. B1I3]